ncbi:hypothetical protein [Tumebacillus flagellatus]|uniref:Uncharacterized protein n=1 Tax=Tumebacillus flagellatus TaxID=1157490 RepID=A0A074LQL4_9BACL|nr:hypothetical protein [Tumebacillus flagellatus]KEO82093.1 hypothetical protein EL26_17440 [Tumebacillus flagellatus]
MAVLASAAADARLLYQGMPKKLGPKITDPTGSQWTVSATTASGSSIPAGTYFVGFTWGNDWSEETVVSPAVQVTVTTGQGIAFRFPAFPTNATKANVYIGTSSSTMKYSTFFTDTVSHTWLGPLPSSNNRLAPVVNTTAMPEVIYTTPSPSPNVTLPSATACVKEIMAANTGSTAATVSLHLVPGGSSPSASNQVLSSLSIPANDVRVLSNLNLMLPANCTLQASQGSSKAILMIISGVEIQ